MWHDLFKLIVCAIYIAGYESNAQNSNLEYHYQQGLTAYEDHDYRKYLDHFQVANQLRPNHQIVMYHLSKAYALNNKTDSSKSYLERAIAIKADLDLNHSSFNNWRSTGEFDTIIKLQQSLMSAVNNSETVLKIKDRTLHIESIAHDPVSNRLFLGSIHQRKILQMNMSNNSVSEFLATGTYGLWSVFGMQVDPRKRHLWVCSVVTELMIDNVNVKSESSEVLKIDIDNGKLLKRYTPADTLKHWFGDLTLAPNGTVFISDSRINHVYQITPEKDELEFFVHDPEFVSLQGLDVTSDGTYLFLSDYIHGPFRISLKNKDIIRVAGLNEQVTLKSIDGLYFYQNSLITTQNQVVPMRVSQYFLNQQMDSMIDFRYLEKGNPILNEPTLGVMVGEYFYYVANSQWGGYDQNNLPKPYDQLQDIYIMRIRMD